MNFKKFEAKHFDDIDSPIWIIARDYCYLLKYWINHNFGLSWTHATTIIEAINKDWNNKWSLEQINQIKEHYYILSKTTCERKTELIGIPNLDNSLVPNTTNSCGLSIESKT